MTSCKSLQGDEPLSAIGPIADQLSLDKAAVENISVTKNFGIELICVSAARWEANHILNHDTILYQYDGMASEFSVDSDALSPIEMMPEEWNFFPAGSHVREREMQHLGRCAIFHFKKGLQNIFREHGELARPPDATLKLSDRRISQISNMLRAQLHSRHVDHCGLDALYLESLTLAVGAVASQRVLGQHSTFDERTVLADTRITRVIDYIEAYLAEPLSVTELAAIATMSAGHFSRCFKATVGEPVWAYVQRRRCERAKELLLHSREPLAEIAYRTGFANQAHMTNSLKERYGATPGAIRKEAN